MSKININFKLCDFFIRNSFIDDMKLQKENKPEDKVVIGTYYFNKKLCFHFTLEVLPKIFIVSV